MFNESLMKIKIPPSQQIPRQMNLRLVRENRNLDSTSELLWQMYGYCVPCNIIRACIIVIILVRNTYLVQNPLDSLSVEKLRPLTLVIDGSY